jgi:hypothetical protein
VWVGVNRWQILFVVRPCSSQQREHRQQNHYWPVDDWLAKALDRYSIIDEGLCAGPSITDDGNGIVKPFRQAVNFSLFFVSISLTLGSVEWNTIIWTSEYMVFNLFSIES